MANTPNLDLKRMEGNPKSTNFNHKEYYENNFEKVDAAMGAAPSTLTTTAKTLVPAIIELESEKVDKVAGKGLSTNDFDNIYKQKIDTDIPAQLAQSVQNFNFKAKDFLTGLRHGTITSIKLVGDSITVGVGAIGGGEDPNGRVILTTNDGTDIREGYKTSPVWANFLEQYINAKHPNVNFVNNGIGGWSATQGYEYVSQWVGTGNDVVFLMLGTNDRNYNNTKDEFEANYKQFLDYVQANSNYVIAMTAPPTLNDFDSSGVQTPTRLLTMEEIDEVISKVCAERKIPHISFYREFLKYQMASSTPWDVLLQTTDSHPVNDGYALMWNILQTELGIVRNTYDWQQRKIDAEKMRVINNSGGSLTTATPITDFPVRSITYSLITAGHPDIANFPEASAGMLITVRGYSDSYSYQEYHINGIQTVYKRAVYGTGWRAWESAREVNLKDSATITNATTITDFKTGISYSLITSGHPDIANFPEASAGALLTYKLGGDSSYWWQEYHIRGSRSVYKRAVYGAGWRVWSKISGHLSLTTAQRNALSSSQILAGDPVFDITLNKPVWRNASNNGFVDSNGTTV